MALVALVYQHKPGSDMALAKLIAFTIIPVFLIGPIAGAWVDRLNKKNIMIISDILRGFLVLLIPLFIAMKLMPLVYITIFIIFSISRFFIPSKMAIIPDIVPKEKLLIANSLQDTTHMIGNVVGLVVAGLIVNIPFIGAIGGFYIDAASFFVSASLIAMIVRKKFVKEVRGDIIATKKALGNSLKISIFAEVKEGWRYIVKHERMHFVTWVFFLFLAGIGAISCVIIVFIQQAFGNATRDLGFLGMCMVVGLFLGTLLYGRFAQKIRKEKAIFASFIMTGLAIMLFAAVVKDYPNFLLSTLLSAFIGFAASPIMCSATTMTHEFIPENARGRIFSSIEAVIHLSFMVFMFIAAYAAKFIDRSWIITAVGTVYFLAGIIGIILKKRQV